MGIDPKAKYVAAAAMTAALGACGTSPTEPVVAPTDSAVAARAVEPSLEELQYQVQALRSQAAAVTIPQEPFGSFYHS
jgi:hypothetical protein